MLTVIVVKSVLSFVVVFVVDSMYIVVGVVFIRLEKTLFMESVVSVFLLSIICLFLFSRFVWSATVWIVSVVLNIVVIISVRMFGRIIGFSVFIMFRLLISELSFLSFNEGMVKMLEKWMLGSKIKSIIEISIMVSRMLLGIFSFFRSMIIVRFISDIIIGKVVKSFSVMGRLLSGFLIIRSISLAVMSSRNRSILIFVLCVILCGKLCKI